jgi:hypothetical protein
LLFLFLLDQIDKGFHNRPLVCIIFLRLCPKTTLRDFFRQVFTFACSAGASFRYRYASLSGIGDNLPDVSAAWYGCSAESLTGTRCKRAALLSGDACKASSLVLGNSLAAQSFAFGQEAFPGISLDGELEMFIA